MKILIASGGERDDSAYLAEILTAFGLCCHERAPLPQALVMARPGQDVLILPLETRSDGVEEFLRAGGQVVSMGPDRPLETMAGLKRVGEDSGFSRLRFVQAVCRGARGEALWTHGATRIYETLPEATGCEVIAHSFKPADPSPAGLGIAEYSIGSGQLVVYCYDLAQCIARLRQGYPGRADILPAGQLTPRAAFLQASNPPPDTFWRPTADLHALAFSEIVRRRLELSAPVPLFWHLPHGAPSLLLFSGDEDAAALSDDEAEMHGIEEYGAAMNLYIFPGNTSLTRQTIDGFSRRGHTVSAHPNISDTAGQSPRMQLDAAEQQVRLFRERFDLPVHTVRNHSYMWPGYLGIPDLWEQLGIGMDCNTTSLMLGESREWGPFAKLNAAIPLRFVREDGTLIDVFQQPTHLNDDLMSQPTGTKSLQYTLEEADAMIERLLDDAARIDHSPICVNFHPGNYVLFSEAPARALLQRATAMNLPIWTVDRWHDFWRARSSWHFETQSWDGTCLNLVLEGLPCEGLRLLLPLRANGFGLSKIRMNDDPAAFELVCRRGRDAAQVALPADQSSVMLKVEYEL